jgi:hypothetical protein
VAHRVEWNQSLVNYICVQAPAAAGAAAAQESAGLAASQIKSGYTGELARQVSVAKPVGPLRWLVGSSLPYAAIEHFGGEIHVKGAQYLAVGARGGFGALPGRSGNVGPGGRGITFIGPGPPPRLTRTGRDYVVHAGKGYLNAAMAAFPSLFLRRYAGMV